MANTVGTPAYMGQVQKIDTSTPAYGPTFDAIHQQLLNNDAFLNSEIMGMLQKAVNSGVIDYTPGTNNATSALGPGQVYTSISTMNYLGLKEFDALINGYKLKITGNGSTIMTLPIDTPPGLNANPSLPGSARDDLLFLEFWLDAITGAPTTRLKKVAGVDFANYPEGLSASNVYAQGGQASDTTKTFSKATSITGQNFSADNGLYVAGTGSSSDKTALATLDGYVYAIPLFRVRRRNNAGFDPDTNPMGARDYYAVNGGYSFSPSFTVGQSQTLTVNTTDYSNMQVGDSLWNGSNYIVNVTAKTAPNLITVQCLAASTPITGLDNRYCLMSTRPDGLYSNIIDASDITDLRHQVSLTGFNYQVLLEKNLDLLLRGQLTTSAGARYARDYIGLNTSGYTDDANTLLYLKFDGSMAGTANGVPVPNTKQGSGGEAYKNGVQGLAADFSAGTYCEQYPVSLGTTGTIEMAFKMPASAPATNAALISGYSDNTASNRRLLVALGANGTLNLTTWDDSGVAGVSMSASAAFVPRFGDSSWHTLRLTFNASGINLYIDGVLAVSGASPLPYSTVSYVVVGSCSSGASSFLNYPLMSLVDLIRISNIVRTTATLLPPGFSAANGDRILDGPNGDFVQWSDDLGGIAGVNGRTNSYGLSRVPNAIAARVNVTGSEIRHYQGNGYTPGWGLLNNTGSTPTGAMDGNGEYYTVTSNESADGTRTTFTFNMPTNASGNFIVDQTNYSHIIQVGSNYVTPTSLIFNPTTGVLTATISAPASGTTVKSIYDTGSRHAHFIPSTKGFIIHDWTDDSLTADGVNKVFQTSKYNVTNLNHVRVAATGATTQTIQNGGYTATVLNSQTALSANALSGATTLSVASGANFVAGQNIRVSKGDGTWYTTTVTSVSGNTITVPAITAALSQNAIVQGAAVVTFTTAPTAGTVDLVYESVYTPSLGDYIRVMYQHIPYQGVIASGDAYQVVAETDAIVTTLGTGVNIGSSVYGGSTGLTACTTNLPTTTPDYSLKLDTFAGTLRPSVSKQFMNSKVDDKPLGSYVHKVKRIGISIIIGSLTTAIRGTAANAMSSPSVDYLYTEQLSASVPNMMMYACLAQNQNGELMLFLLTNSQTTNQPFVEIGGNGTIGMDAFKIKGRPLIKGYNGGAAA